MLGKRSAALADFNRVVEIDPQSPLGYVNRAIIEAEQGDYKNVIKDIGTAMELGYVSAPILAMRGMSFLRLGKAKQGFADLDRAIELDPDFPDSYMDRGLEYLSRRKYSKAIDDFTRLIELRPEAQSYFLRGLAFEGLMEIERAIEDYSEAIRLAPEAEYFLSRASSRLLLGELSEAIEDCDKAVECDPQSCRPYLLKAEILEKMGHLSEALRCYETFVRLADRSVNPKAIKQANKRISRIRKDLE